MDILIGAEQLNAWSHDPALRILDVRYSLQDAGAGEQAYRQAHIPGAQYASISHDLAGEVIPGETGRHPLPLAEAFVATIQRWGITASSRVVLYDDGSHFFVPRLWWMLAVWMGHPQVFILHGGMRTWQENSLPLTDKVVAVEPSQYLPVANNDVVAQADQLLSFVDAGGALLDARAEERFRGDVEPLDTQAGHIPGAILQPYSLTVNDQGDFLPRDQLSRVFESVRGQDVICYCGSGITACQNILAMALAGMPMPRLYPGSWSEWITDPQRPVATGA